MGVEIEAKMRIADLDAVRAKLKSVGATFVGRTNEVNRFYDAPDARLSSADRGLRLRTNANADTGEATHVVTMKGPRQKGAFKTREELEFTVDDVDAVANVFAHLGYPLNLSFEKRRESWTLDGCKIELDEMPVFGTFVEVEAVDEAAIEAIQKKLGLAGEPSISEGYATMVAKHLKTTGGRELRFS
ncbi:class IV adenylate cyclase [Humisphaera borealis]|uniref:Class IV adenylate cyclase n=1 Tax=Humisphaera borealis TaxID=2807512 RepID=A0A7M2WRJ0_9BACT|nr:class IV adenylate cyclase [Humisphaera borealis]QOV88128.1 class IV adenylate cyclase [Humisphaera borealis]